MKLRKYLFLIFICLFLIKDLYAQSIPNIEGVWNTEGNAAKVQILKEGNIYFGKILELKEPKNEFGKEKLDKNNPDKYLRNRPLLGIRIIEGLKFKDGIFQNGKIYSPEKGIYAFCKLKLKDIYTLELRVNKGFLTLNKIWKKST